MSFEVRVGNVRYIYTIVGGGAGGGSALGFEALQRKRRATSFLSSLASQINGATGEDKAKLEKIRDAISALTSMLNKVPPKLQGKIMAMIEKLVSAVESGRLDGAEADAADALDFGKRCVTACERCTNAMGRLSTLMANLPASGKAAVGALLQNAEKALQNADSPGAVEQIAGALEFAVDVVNTLVGADENSAVYQGNLHLLGAIMGDIGNVGSANGPDGLAAMPEDALSLSIGKASDAVTQLKAGTKDEGRLRQLGALDVRIKDIQRLAAGLPQAFRDGQPSFINRLISDAANGKLAEALQAAEALHSKLDQAAKLHMLVERKLDFAAVAASRLPVGPQRQALEAIARKAREALPHCVAPEDFARLEALLLDAVTHAQTRPRHAQEARGCHLKLQGLQRQCDALIPKKAFGDAFVSPRESAAAARGHAVPPSAGTRPLNAAQRQHLGTAPLGHDALVIALDVSLQVGHLGALTDRELARIADSIGGAEASEGREGHPSPASAARGVTARLTLTQKP